jgi:hypothetical protein
MSNDQNKAGRETEDRPIEDSAKHDNKWFDLTKLIIGFLLTGVIGSCVSQMYKEREIRADVQRKELEAATNVFYEVVDALSKRHYYALRANAAVEQWANQDEAALKAGEGRRLLDTAYKLYDDSVIEWNSHRFRTRIILNTYFDNSYFNELEYKIVPVLGRTKEDLDNLRDHALDDGYYDQSLHDKILDRIENEEETALVKLCERLSDSIKDREKHSDGIFSWFSKSKSSAARTSAR